MRAAETRGLGYYHAGTKNFASQNLYPGPEQSYIRTVQLGDRYTGQVLHSDLGKVRQLTKFGHQDLGLLSDNEKKLAAIAVLGIVGWFLFKKQIKKALK